MLSLNHFVTALTVLLVFFVALHPFPSEPYNGQMAKQLGEAVLGFSSDRSIRTALPRQAAADNRRCFPRSGSFSAGPSEAKKL